MTPLPKLQIDGVPEQLADWEAEQKRKRAEEAKSGGANKNAGAAAAKTTGWSVVKKGHALVGTAAVVLPVAALASLALVVIVVRLVLSHSHYASWLRSALARAWSTASRLGVLAKLKLTWSHFQVVLMIPEIYGIKHTLPAVYNDVMRFRSTA